MPPIPTPADPAGSQERREEAPEVPAAGIWRHYKGQRYLVLGLARHTETGEELVCYVSLYDVPGGGPGIQVRPLAMWFEGVDYRGIHRPRFTYEGPRR